MSALRDVERLELRLLLEAIYERHGYDLRKYEPAAIRRRFGAIMAKSGVTHYGELQHRILHDASFFAGIVDDLTVQVSEMFRDPAFYLAFREHVVPVLRTYPQLKIWHAGCAGGEEAYTMAIVLTEEKLYERAQIYATDLSSSAVDRAREGVYTEQRAVLFAENYRKAGGRSSFDDYCSRAYGHVTLREAVRRNVVLFQHDLATDHALGEMQVVCCRNVFIYFTPALRERVLGIFKQALSRGGFLCLGAAERLSPAQLADFVPVDEQRAIYRARVAS
jgi:chemotaxis protein methyltransferase CheR